MDLFCKFKFELLSSIWQHSYHRVEAAKLLLYMSFIYPESDIDITKAFFKTDLAKRAVENATNISSQFFHTQAQ